MKVFLRFFLWLWGKYERAQSRRIRPSRKTYMTITDRGAVIFHWDEFYRDHPEALKREQEEIKKFFEKHGRK